MNKAFLYAGGFILGLVANGAFAATISLYDSVNRALSVDLRNQLERNNIQSSQAGLSAAKSSDLKTALAVKMGTDITKNRNKDRKLNLENTLTLTQNLYDGGFKKSNEGMANSKVHVSQQSARIAQSKIVGEVVKEYINILRLRSMRKTLVKNVLIMKELRDEYARRVDTGVGQKSILSRLEQRVIMLEISVDDFNTQLKSSEDKLRYLLQVNSGFNLDLKPIEVINAGLISNIRNAVESNNVDILNHPQVIRLRHQIDIAKHDYDSRSAGESPSLDLEGKATMRREAEKNESELGVYLKMNWNLTNIALKHRVKEKQVSYNNARLEYQFVRNKLISDLRSGLMSLDSVSKRFINIQKAHTQLTSVERDSYVRFTTLAKQGQEYLSRADVVNEFYASETRVISSYYEKILIEYNLVNTAGRILNQFGK